MNQSLAWDQSKNPPLRTETLDFVSIYFTIQVLVNHLGAISCPDRLLTETIESGFLKMSYEARETKGTEAVQICKTLWLKSTQVNRELNNSLSYIHGIGLAEYMVLDRLMAAPRQTLSRIDLANNVGRTASAITKMLAPMEKIGLVEKEVGARDARVSLVKLTPTGERIYGEASESLEQTANRLVESLDSEESEQFLRLLQRFPA